tara:strand:+ start:357 stop:464 length:108 start_codon:yes stop_codon:yes gene_type:complete
MKKLKISIFLISPSNKKIGYRKIKNKKNLNRVPKQ